jgi:hypothetical protein
MTLYSGRARPLDMFLCSPLVKMYSFKLYASVIAVLASSLNSISGVQDCRQTFSGALVTIWVSYQALRVDLKESQVTRTWTMG